MLLNAIEKKYMDPVTYRDRESSLHLSPETCELGWQFPKVGTLMSWAYIYLQMTNARIKLTFGHRSKDKEMGSDSQTLNFHVWPFCLHPQPVNASLEVKFTGPPGVFPGRVAGKCRLRKPRGWKQGASKRESPQWAVACCDFCADSTLGSHMGAGAGAGAESAEQVGLDGERLWMPDIWV